MAKSAPKKTAGASSGGAAGAAAKGGAAARGPARRPPAASARPANAKAASAKPAAKASAANAANANAKGAAGRSGPSRGSGSPTSSRRVATVPLDREPRRTADRQASQAGAAAREAKARSSPKAPSDLVAARPQDTGSRPPRGADQPVPPVPVPAAVPEGTSANGGKPRKNQAGIGAKELEHYRDLLLEKRRELVGDMSSMEREALRTSGGSNLSTLPIHMADMGTDNYEQEFTLGLVEKDRVLLREINHALAKIQNGTFGICEGTGQPISKPRLEAQPWARFSIEYARQHEKGGVRR